MINTKTQEKQRSDFLVWMRSRGIFIFLIPLTIVCLYLTIQNTPSLAGFGQYFISPVHAVGLLFSNFLLYLLLSLFGVSYIYAAAKSRYLSKFAQVTAWFFVSLSTIAFFYVMSGVGLKCTGLFGVQTGCEDVNLLTVVILLLNPFAIILWEILAVVSIARLFLKSRAKLDNATSGRNGKKSKARKK